MMAIPTRVANVRLTAVAWAFYLSVVMVRFVRSLNPAMTVMPMPAEPAMLIAPVPVLVPPAATVKFVLNSKLVTMVSLTLVAVAMLTVPERELDLFAVTAMSVLSLKPAMMVLRMLAVRVTPIVLVPEALPPVVTPNYALNLKLAMMATPMPAGLVMRTVQLQEQEQRAGTVKSVLN